MNNKEIIFRWLDGILETQIPEEVEAIYFNLVESINLVDVEFFGIGKFEPDDEDWACDDIFQAKSIEIAYDEDVSGIWKNVLKEISSIIADYVNIKSNNVQLLALKRIGVGFGDSEIVIIKDEI